MEKIDARKLSLEILEEKRREAHRLRKRGMTRAEIGEILGIHADTIGRWLKLTKNEMGYDRPGRKAGSGRRMTDTQEQRIKALITDKTPDQLKMPYALWTRESVRELIQAQCGIDMPIRTVGDYLKRWGMTPQKPQKRAYEQRAPEVKAWLEEEYPAIQERAKQENAEIYWGDETGLRNDCQHERGYAPKGKTPVIHLNAKRESINMISAITNQGKVRFRIFDGSMNADVLIEFMMRLLKDAKRKIYLILDNMRVHHAKPVKEWLEDHKKMIEVFYLPAYSPELNPDEYLNCDLKAGVHSGVPARSKSQLKEKTSKHMRMLQRKPARVRKYFEHRNIRYAA
jgi:transposase